MKKKTTLLLGLELVWWLFTVLIVMAVLSPIDKAIYQFVFRPLNIVFIVVFITLARYTFLLKYAFWSKFQLLKIALIFGSMLLVLYLIDGMNGFLNYIEEETWVALIGHLPMDSPERTGTQKYIWNEMLFFGTGSIIATVAFAGRMLISIWRTHNLDTV